MTGGCHIWLNVTARSPIIRYIIIILAVSYGGEYHNWCIPGKVRLKAVTATFHLYAHNHGSDITILG